MRLYKRGKVYWVDYQDAAGKRQRHSLFVKSKRVAERMYAEIVARVQRQKLGLETPIAFAGPITPHLEAFELYLTHKGVTDAHLREVLRFLGDFLAQQEVATLGQLTKERAEAFLARERRRPPKSGHKRNRSRGLSNRSVNKRRAALRSFSRWLLDTERLQSDPFRTLKALPDGDPRHPRRALPEAEFTQLLAVAPPYRQLYYLFLARTGIRSWREIGRVVWRDLQLEGDDPGLVFRASATKNRKADRIPLHPDLVVGLRALKAGTLELGSYARLRAMREWERGPLEPVFPIVPTNDTLKEDLATAGIPYETEQGFADRHGLRVKFGTDLMEHVPLPVLQRLLRHSSPTLTANLYTRARDQVKRTAIMKLPSIGESRTPDSPKGAEQRASEEDVDGAA